VGTQASCLNLVNCQRRALRRIRLPRPWRIRVNGPSWLGVSVTGGRGGVGAAFGTARDHGIVSSLSWRQMRRGWPWGRMACVPTTLTASRGHRVLDLLHAELAARIMGGGDEMGVRAS